MTGDGPKPEVYQGGLAAIRAEQGRGIPIIKPREPEQIVKLANEAAQAGAVAFGIDIDAAALINMTRMGQPVGPKSFAELEFIKRNTKIPFIVKGIMTVDEALACVEAGVDAMLFQIMVAGLWIIRRGPLKCCRDCRGGSGAVGCKADGGSAVAWMC